MKTKVATADRIKKEQLAVVAHVPVKVKAEPVAPTADEIKSATANHRTVVTCLKETAGTFLKLSRALFAINSLGQYKALGFKSWAKYLESQDVNFSIPQSKGYIRLGRMLATVMFPEHDKLNKEMDIYLLNVTDDEMMACGYSSMLELSRLAQTPKAFQEHSGEIMDYINMRAKGRITHAKLKVEIDDILGVGKGRVDAEVQEGSEDRTTGAETATTDVLNVAGYPDWKRSILKMVASSPDMNNFMASLQAYCESVKPKTMAA